jgi:hypothetical protein
MINSTADNGLTLIPSTSRAQTQTRASPQARVRYCGGEASYRKRPFSLSLAGATPRARSVAVFYTTQIDTTPWLETDLPSWRRVQELRGKRCTWQACLIRCSDRFQMGNGGLRGVCTGPCTHKETILWLVGNLASLGRAFLAG